jgi:hypothetical protein
MRSFEVLSIADIVRTYPQAFTGLLSPSDFPQETPMANETRVITKQSMFSGKENTLSITAPAADWALFDAGTELIQHALPTLTQSEREFLITGCTDAEWNELFGEPEEDE